MTTCRHLLLLSLWAACVSCSATQTPGAASSPAEALTLSIQYADTHYPPGTFQPGNARLQYIVEDQGDAWKVDLAPIGYIGGGLSVAVRKSDMKVISALRTQ